MRSAQVILIITMLFMSSAFQRREPMTQNELIEQYIEEKLEESRIDFWNACRNRIIKDAEMYVDSIIYETTQFSISDTLYNPGRPVKPIRPFDTLELDSSPIIPVLKKDSLK